MEKFLELYSNEWQLRV